LPALRRRVLGDDREVEPSLSAASESRPEAAAKGAEKGREANGMSRPLVPMKNPPGRKPKHGSRALARAIEANKLDRRTRPAKLRQQAANLMAEDAGGWPNLNNREVALIWTTASVWVLLNLRLDALLAGEGNEDQGSLKWLVALLNSFRRNLEVLGLKPERVEDRIPTLEQYLASRSASSPSDGNGSQAHQDGSESTNEPGADAMVEGEQDVAEGSGE